MVAVRRSVRRRVRAPWSGRYPSRCAASSTRSVRAGDTPPSRFTTRETVLRLTPARAATSRMVALPDGAGVPDNGVITDPSLRLATLDDRV